LVWSIAEVSDEKAGAKYATLLGCLLSGSVLTVCSCLCLVSSSRRLEFSIPEVADDEFYPIGVQFTSDTTYSGIQVSASCRFPYTHWMLMQITSVVHAETQKPVKFAQRAVLGVERYTIS
jgi:hypothetical protein